MFTCLVILIKQKKHIANSRTSSFPCCCCCCRCQWDFRSPAKVFASP